MKCHTATDSFQLYASQYHNTVTKLTVVTVLGGFLLYQAQSENKHSLTFCVRHYVVIATKLVHQLQICPIVHNQRALPTIPSTYTRVCAVMWECGKGQTNTHTAVTNIHFASAMPHAKCNKVLAHLVVQE